jgi:DNA-binding response OmpR family regulator
MPIVVFVPRSTIEETPSPQSTDAVVVDAGRSRDIPFLMRAAMTRFGCVDAEDVGAFGVVAVRFSTMETCRNGQPLKMTCKEFKMLEYMIKNPGKVISRDELLNEVWGYESYPCTRTIDTHMLRLRCKLEQEPSEPRHFLTVHRVGYKFLP